MTPGVCHELNLNGVCRCVCFADVPSLRAGILGSKRHDYLTCLSYFEALVETYGQANVISPDRDTLLIPIPEFARFLACCLDTDGDGILSEEDLIRVKKRMQEVELEHREAYQPPPRKWTWRGPDGMRPLVNQNRAFAEEWLNLNMTPETQGFCIDSICRVAGGGVFGLQPGVHIKSASWQAAVYVAQNTKKEKKKNKWTQEITGETPRGGKKK